MMSITTASGSDAEIEISVNDVGIDVSNGRNFEIGLRRTDFEFFYVRRDLRSPIEWEADREYHTLIVIVESAFQKFELSNDYGVSHKLPVPGSVFILPRASRCSARGEGRLVEFGILKFRPEMLAGITGGLVETTDMRPVAFGFDEFSLQCVRMLGTTLQRSYLAAITICARLPEVLACHILIKYQNLDVIAQPKGAGLTPGQRLIIESQIEQSIDSKIDVQRLADSVSMTSYKFLKAFKESYSTSLTQYVLDWRVSRARDLLINTSLDITEISLICGFAHHSHLSNMFKRKFGVSPGEYRRMAFC